MFNRRFMERVLGSALVYTIAFVCPVLLLSTITNLIVKTLAITIWVFVASTSICLATKPIANNDALWNELCSEIRSDISDD